MSSGSSRTSGARSQKRSYRYRIRANTSEVDETLFGYSAPSDKHGKPDKDKNTVQVITRDLIRTLRIPLKDPSGESLILPRAEFQRMNLESTKEEKEAQKKAYQKKKEEEIKAADEMKRRIIEIDQSRKKNQTLTELDVETQERAQHLVERANAFKMEQEEEIRNFNSLIVDAQCQAIRDVQIQEKKENQAKQLEEEKRLDTMMEVERRKALETEKQLDDMRKNQRISGMEQICDQISKRLEDKKMQEEMKEYEKQQIRENQEKMNLDDLKTLEKKREEQQRLQEEVMRINAETMRAKEQRREEEKLADMRDMEYLRNKLQREAEYEAEQRRIKKEKELEITRLRAQQEKAKDYKAQQDELRARRNEESTRREWRRKEKELAIKKAQEEAMLRAARLDQVRCKEHFLSIEAGREKAEFERVLKVQQEAIIKQKEEEEKQHRKAQLHAEAVRQQMRERELSATAKRREVFEDAHRLTEEARQRQIRLSEIKEKKLKELKATGIHEKYCKQVEKTRTTM